MTAEATHHSVNISNAYLDEGIQLLYYEQMICVGHEGIALRFLQVNDEMLATNELKVFFMKTNQCSSSCEIKTLL